VNRSQKLRSVSSFAALCVAGALLAGCSAGTPTASTPSGGMQGGSMQTTSAADPNAQLCAECGGMGAPKATAGEAIVDGGAQVVSIAIDGGYYVPNKITAKAGVPTKVVFTGSAKGCVAKPKFASLGKSGDLTAIVSTTVDLGTLTAGVYEFSCGMGVNKGTITVE
jgi:plastocyanin